MMREKTRTKKNLVFRFLSLLSLPSPSSVLQTERAYFYRDITNDLSNSTEYLIDTSVSNSLIGLTRGVQESDGDGTVPLLSLG